MTTTPGCRLASIKSPAQHSSSRDSKIRKAALLAPWLLLGFSVSMASLADHTPGHIVYDQLQEFSEGGVIGIYIKQVDGPIIEHINDTYVFEPASTIKALAHFHAFKQIEDEAVIDGEVVELIRFIDTYLGQVPTCPTNPAPNQNTIGALLRMMMELSHNPATQAIRDFFGADAINQTAAELGMDDSLWQHVIGCGADIVANPNQLTLVDIGKLYEAVATGYLNESTRNAAYARMSSINGSLSSMFQQEASDLGLSNQAVSAFVSMRRSAAKAGGYEVNGLHYGSLAGWASIPFKDGQCETEMRDFVWGAFIDSADDITFPVNPNSPTGDRFSIWDYAPFMLRGVVRVAAETWAECEADLEVVNVEVLAPPDEIDVNSWTNITVRATVTNNGPASSVDTRVRFFATYPSDCEGGEVVDVPVNSLAKDATVQVSRTFSINCSQPCFHLLDYRAHIDPQNSLVRDPDSLNNLKIATLTPALIARADLAILDWDFSALDDALLGSFLLDQTTWIDTIKTVRNLGDTESGLYSDPVDGDVSRAISVPEDVAGGVAIGDQEDPAIITVDQPGEALLVLDDQAAGTELEVDGPVSIAVHFTAPELELGVDRLILERFGVYCGAPGVYEIQFSNEIEPGLLHVRDPDPSNNSEEVWREIECLTPVQINIRPGNPHNFIQPGSHQAVPVAILTTEAGEYGLPVAFDATNVDWNTVRFGTIQTLTAGDGAAAWPDRSFIRDSFEMDDRTRDGDLDMVLLFQISDTGADEHTEELCATGRYEGDDGNLYTFFGCDFVNIVPGSSGGE